MRISDMLTQMTSPGSVVPKSGKSLPPPQFSTEVDGAKVRFRLADGSGRVALIPGPIAKKLADLNIHNQVIIDLFHTINHLRQFHNTISPLFESCFFGVIVRFFSCFNRSDTTGPLIIRKIIEGHVNTQQLSEYFSYFENYRNNIVAHSQGDFENAAVGLAISDNEIPYNVQTYLYRYSISHDEFYLNAMWFLVTHTGLWIEKEIEKYDGKLREIWVSGCSDKTSTLPDLEMNLPSRERDSKNLRRKYNSAQ